MSQALALADYKTGSPQLSQEIQRLKEFAEPLEKEVTVTPLMPVIARIMSLPEELDDLSEREIRHIEAEVAECRRLLDEISYDYISQIISKPEPSKVFRILGSANKFEKALKSAVGRTIRLEDGREAKITPALVDCLTRFRFSLGTPPITPKGIETVESILFGGTLHDIYAFRDLIQVDKGLFDRFLGAVDRLVEQSTHYTTATEKEEFEHKSKDFCNLEGLRGLTKTVISGTTKTVIRLMQEHLLSKHSNDDNGSMPLRVMEQTDKLDADLINEMKRDKRSIFVVRVTSVPHHIFTDDVLKGDWKGVIGRLVIIDESENAARSGTTLVYSLHPRITDALAQFHVKDAGTPASTQMNLRLILENFKKADLQNLKVSVDGKIKQLEAEGVHELSAEEVRKKEWLLSAQKDYLALKKFRGFLDFIEKMKTAAPAELNEYGSQLAAQTADQSMRYFFKNLQGKGYKCIAVPQGGGRRELAHPGKFYLQRCSRNSDEFKKQKLEECRKRLKKLKSSRGIDDISTSAEAAALDRAILQRQSPNRAIQGHRERGVLTGRITQHVKASLKDALHDAQVKGEELIEQAIQGLDEILGINLPGFLKSKITTILKKYGIESAAKILERGGFRDAANRLRAFTGRIRRTAMGTADSLLQPLDVLRRQLEPPDLDFAERMLNDIEHGSFQPSLALAEMSWTIDDILIEEKFPSKNYLRIEMTPDGQLDPDSLEQQLEAKRHALAYFPELFELYCSSILLYVNDPHNPTSQVATPKVKLRLLDIASRYNLTILSDEPYHKQVAKAIKERDGDAPLAEFYEQNRSRFPNPVTIYTTISTTKWAMGAGRRTGVLLTNDQSKNQDGLDIEKFVAANTDSVNTVSLYMDQRTLATGLLVKKVCKELEPAIVLKNPIAAIDKLLTEEFSDLSAADFNVPVYTALLEASNDLDRLAVRGAGPMDYRKYISDFISRLKNLRLDKQTQRDSAKRSQAAVAAVKNLSQEFPGLEKRCIKPQGPFYCCVQLDETGKDSGLQPFLEAIARVRKIDVVPLAKGYVRFAFGGSIDGSKESYELLTLAIETDLRLLLKYWEQFKQKRTTLDAKKDLDPIFNALKAIFPGGEEELVKTIEDKKPLLDRLQSSRNARKKRLTNRFSATDSAYLASIEPQSPATIVTIRGVKCKTVEDFINSEAFCDLFNHYLLKAKKEIPLLEQMEQSRIISEYGARRFAEKFHTRDFNDVRKDVFEEIAIKVANLWFGADNIKILGLQFPEGVDRETQADALMGAEKRISEFIKQFLKAFISEERESEVDYKPTFQAGYEAIRGVKAATTLPPWQRSMIDRSEFAGQTIATDPSPAMVTPGAARVAGFTRGIYRRDGDGDCAPKADFFRKRFKEFAEVMNPKDYICKMVQIGPTRLMLVMHKSYSHYLVEELRLLPQFDASLDDLENLKPDAISFMGIPTKVIGPDYRIGYFLDECSDDNKTVIPVSWVDVEDITDYMGYLKKPLLTMGNERVKTIGGLPVHGSAFTIEMRNGLRKTIVMAGDSGTGKSETIIAMVEQTIQGLGGAQNVKSIELLSGDMLSLFVGEDNQIYMLGTESGDFMRLTDISDNWQERFRDLLYSASKTNPDHPTNPRATINGLCNPQKFLRPVRVNMFFNINNFDKPPGTSFKEDPDPENLLLEVYTRGYRREKGTSGDQPNIFASVLYSNSQRKQALLEKYNEEFDRLLGWDLILAETGKVKNAILSFNDISGEVFRARNMVKDLFLGESVEIDKKPHAIKQINYNVHENRFYVTVQAEDGQTKQALLDRSIFDQVYSPIASTYCGNPFIDPRGMDKILRRFARAMKYEDRQCKERKKDKDMVLTGTLYTQLAIEGEQFNGPARAAQAIIEFIQSDPRINERFQDHKKKVLEELGKKYGDKILGQAALPEELEAYNLWLLERQESDMVSLVDENGKIIPIKTPHYPKPKSDGFKPSLITPEILQGIGDIIRNPDAANINLEQYNPALEQYSHIQVANSTEELIYQILLINGIMRLGDAPKTTALWIHEIKKAEKAANLLKQARPGIITT